jgi:hypothetical protein
MPCRHAQNSSTLLRSARLLGDEELVEHVQATHKRFDLSPRSACVPLGLFSGGALPANLSLQLSTISTSASDGPDATTPTAPLSGSHSKNSLEGSAKTLRKMSSSVKTVFGSMRRFIRSDRMLQNADELAL